MFKLEIETGGETFQEDPDGATKRALEINARLLEVAARLRDPDRVPQTQGLIRDSNGSTVGMWQFSE